jgi:2-methylaconitate cis-trans-isomerase PrpF
VPTVLEGVLARGVTSKCWIFSLPDMARINASYDEILSFAFGASDTHELDGIGGGTSVTPRAAIVQRSCDAEVDIDYLFAQIGLGTSAVEWRSICGNCATAVGLYAVRLALVAVAGDTTPVCIRNVHTSAVMVTTVATPGGVVRDLDGRSCRASIVDADAPAARCV